MQRGRAKTPSMDGAADEKAAANERQRRLVAELAAIEAAATCGTNGAVSGEDGAFARVAELLADERKLVRRAAARALTVLLDCGRVRAETATPLLDAPDARRRWGAAYALSRSGLDDARILDIAFEVLGDPDGDLRWAASAILAPQASCDDGLRAKLRQETAAADPVRRKMALLCLSDAGEADAGMFRNALRDADLYVRLAGIRALGRLGRRDDTTLVALGQLADSDDAANVRRAAAAVRERLGGGDTEK
jgi:hypothetical protein